MNARNALRFAREQLHAVDPNRIFAVGHSSAGTLTLLLTAHESRIQGCVAYAPVTNVEQQLEPLEDWAAFLPGCRQLLRDCSPDTYAASLACPVLLIHAVDDPVVPVEHSIDLARQLDRLQKSVNLKLVPTGGYYEFLIAAGIRRAISWLKSHAPIVR